MKYIRAIFELVQETAVSYGRNKGSLLAAALAYYTVFSLAPLLVIAVAVAGFFLGEAAVEGELVAQLQDVLGPELATFIQRTIENVSSPGANVAAAGISTGLLLYGASNVFNQLKAALNTVWGIAPDPESGILFVLLNRLLSLVMVLGIGFLLLIAVITTTILRTLGGYIVELFPTVGLQLMQLDFVLSLVLLTLIFAVIFKALPDAKVAWLDVLLGAAVTAVLFSVGVYLISFYLSNWGNVGAVYGAASSLVVLLFWIFLSAQIMLFGAQFTRVYANKHGAQVVPNERALIIAQKPYRPPEPAPAPIPAATAAPETADSPPRHLEKQVAAGLIGIAIGLLLAILGQRREKR